jgi:hypothetical protein
MLVGAIALAFTGLAGVALAQEETTPPPTNCDRLLGALDKARTDQSAAVKAAEARAVELGLSSSLISNVTEDLTGGLSAGEKAAALSHLPEVIAAGGGNSDDLKLALRVEEASSLLATAEKDARGCEPEPVGDLDCNDFPLADGRTAQEVFDEDKNDPHNLDADDNGIPCEFGDTDYDDTSDYYIPDTSDGISTGGA